MTVEAPVTVEVDRERGTAGRVVRDGGVEGKWRTGLLTGYFSGVELT